jgi:hypothetical protein
MFGRCSVIAVLHCDLRGIPHWENLPMPRHCAVLMGVEGLGELREVAHVGVSPILDLDSASASSWPALKDLLSYLHGTHL